MIELVARQSCRGDVYVNLARIYLARHEWGLALRAVHAGLDKGGLSDALGAVCLLGEIQARVDTCTECEPAARQRTYGLGSSKENETLVYSRLSRPRKTVTSSKSNCHQFSGMPAAKSLA